MAEGREGGVGGPGMPTDREVTQEEEGPGESPGEEGSAESESGESQTSIEADMLDEELLLNPDAVEVLVAIDHIAEPDEPETERLDELFPPIEYVGMEQSEGTLDAATLTGPPQPDFQTPVTQQPSKQKRTRRIPSRFLD